MNNFCERTGSPAWRNKKTKKETNLQTWSLKIKDGTDWNMNLDV